MRDLDYLVVMDSEEGVVYAAFMERVHDEGDVISKESLTLDLEAYICGAKECAIGGVGMGPTNDVLAFFSCLVGVLEILCGEFDVYGGPYFL